MLPVLDLVVRVVAGAVARAMVGLRGACSSVAVVLPLRRRRSHRRRRVFPSHAGPAPGRRGPGLFGVAAPAFAQLAAVSVLVVVMGGVWLGAPASAVAGGGCANEARRAEQSSTYLPDCRAYEQVTPVAKDAGEPWAVRTGLNEREPFEPIRGARAAVNGDRMAWVSEYSLPGLSGASTLGLNYLSTRGSEGWSTEATVPPQSPENGLLCPNLDGMVGWSSNLTKGVLSDGDGQEYGSGQVESFYGQGFGCGHAEPALKEADGAEIKEPVGFQNLFLRDSNTASYQLVNVTSGTPPIPTPTATPIPSRQVAKLAGHGQIYFPPNFLAGTAELRDVAFEDELPLTEEAEKLTPEVETACKEEPKGRACWEGHDDLYVWNQGLQPAVRLVTVLPNGQPVEGELAGSTSSADVGNSAEEIMNVADYRHAMSADGSRTFFEAGGNLYVRVNAGVEQSKLDPAHETAVNGEQCAEAEMACTIQLDAVQDGAGSGGGKWLGASDDGTKVFFTDERDLTATATAKSGKPDLYEYDFEAPQGQRVKDLTEDAAEPADVQGVSGISEDGAYVYFVANAALPNSGENSHSAKPVGPAAGTGSLIGPVSATSGSVVAGSTKVTISSVSGEFHVNQEIEAEEIPASTTITACSPNCSHPTELTLSKAVTATHSDVKIVGLGEYKVTGVTTSTGVFQLGMAITGPGIPTDTWITACSPNPNCSHPTELTLSRRATVSGVKTLSAVGENLYLNHEGVTTFIGSLSGADLCDWTSNTGCNLVLPSAPEATGSTARVSGNGRYLAFNSINELTGYDNIGPECVPLYKNAAFTDKYGPGSCEEILLYEAEDGNLVCVSCNSNGAPSVGGADIDWPAPPDRNGEVKSAYPQHNVSETGQVFFETAEALLPQEDINGVRDVYEYEHGALQMISSGTSSAPSYFLDATPSGSDVFFATAQKLVGRDTDSAYDIYDARVGGGFPEPAPPPLPCESEGCKGAAGASPVFSAPPSTTFAGPGNAVVQTTAPTKPKPLTRAQKLAQTLRACGKDRSKKKRASCVRRARKRYGHDAKAKASHTTKKRGR